MRYPQVSFCLLAAGCALLGLGCAQKSTSVPASQSIATGVTIQATSTDSVEAPLLKGESKGDYGSDGDLKRRDASLDRKGSILCLMGGGQARIHKSPEGRVSGTCTFPNASTCTFDELEGDACSSLPPTYATDVKVTPSLAPIAERPKTEPMKASAGGESKSPSSNQALSLKPSALSQSGLSVRFVKGEESGEMTTSWTTSGVSAPDGFLVMFAGHEPVNEQSKYVKRLYSPTSRSYTWTGLVPGRTYYTRVCVAKGSVCGLMSDTVKATAN